MNEPVFDFGLNFKPAIERVAGEALERATIAQRMLKFGHAFLDDALIGILPNDLVLIGAETGTGKTDLARIIAQFNAAQGRRVHYIALEAEEKEIERRILYALISAIGRERRCMIPRYPEWAIGASVPVVVEHEANERFRAECKTLQTYYRGSRFATSDLRRLILSVQDQTDLIILDHLHYVDIEDANENRGLKDLIKTTRDVALGVGRPVILIAHLRKRDLKAKSIAPTIDDFHGSSDVAKIATRAVILSPARCLRSDIPGVANTFFQVVKDRLDGAKPHVAMCKFSFSTKDYLPGYSLGFPLQSGDGWQSIERTSAPAWALRHSEYNHEEKD